MRHHPRSRASASSGVPDALTVALTLLGQRELSTAQLRQRLTRRGCADEDVDAVIERLTADRTLDDRRAALAAARLETRVRHRGPARVRQRLQAMGLAPDVVKEAVSEVFGEGDEDAQLEAALHRRLKGRSLPSLDDRERQRLVRALVGQGFGLGLVLKYVRARATEP